MDKRLADIIKEPDKKDSQLVYIKRNNQEFLQANDGSKYIINDNIINFLGEKEIIGKNGYYQKLYDHLAPFYDLITRTYAFITNGSEKKRVMQYLSKLIVNDSDDVIEISIGTGRNIKYLNSNANYFGVDISSQMLRICSKTMKRLKRKIKLIKAEAEHLPFENESFDVVFSAGGFNFFNDKKKAINEMIRTAKKGTKILISDETIKIKKKYEKKFVSSKFYSKDDIYNPIEFVPKECKNIQYEEICNDELYVLTFYKP